MKKRKTPLFIEFICALSWKIGQGFLAVGEELLDPFTWLVDDTIEWGRDLLDEYRNRGKAEETKPKEAGKIAYKVTYGGQTAVFSEKKNAEKYVERLKKKSGGCECDIERVERD